MNIGIVIFIFALLIAVLLSSHPIAFALGGLSMLLGVAVWGDMGTLIPIFSSKIVTLVNNPSMLAAPLYLFMGVILDNTGITHRLFKGMRVLVGRVPGGIGIGALIISILLAASTGIVTATITLLTVLALPRMLEMGYNKSLAGGIVMSGGCLGIIIPPSLMLIVYGATMEESVGQLFAAALIPGIILGVLYIAYVFVYAKLKPEEAPGITREEFAAFTRKDFVEAFLDVFPPLLLIIGVLGSIISGIATPTEAAVVGIIVSLLLGVRHLTWEGIKESCFSTTKATTMCMWIMFGGACFQSIFYGIGGQDAIVSAFLGLQVSPFAILAVMMGLLFIFGMLMDWMAILVIFMPTFIMVAKGLGMNTIWFALLFCIVMQTGFLTPPFGGALFFCKAVAPKEVSMIDLIKSVPPFVAIQVFVLILCIVFPQIVTWLPGRMF